MEQSIFTYCYKRYGETGGGWGFYSYSDGMKAYFEQEESLEKIAGSAGYELAQNRDVWLIRQITNYNEDIECERLAIERYHPEKFAYRMFDVKGKDTAVFTFGRNLGREIMNESRPANKLIYTLAGNVAEVEDYPCFYYGNSDFHKMTRTFFKQSNSDMLAPMLSSIKVKVSDSITRQKIHDFLMAEPEREDLLVNLFYALIDERSGKQRPILICDRKDNIVYWIAAVTLLFPLEIAMKIFFTTYDFLGTNIGVAEIPYNIHLCGVYSPTINDAPEAEATNYDIGKLENNENIVLFDLECGIFPKIQKDSFEYVIHAFCKGDEKPLMAFHQYLSENINYRDFDRTYTMFCPMAHEKNELFQYYNTEVQKRMFSDKYPFLFDVNASTDEINNAVQLTQLAFDKGIVTKKQLFDDIYRFAAESLRNPSDDFTRLKRLDPIIKLTGHTADNLVKAIINQNLDKWIEYFVLQNGISINKLICILNLFSTYNSAEMPVVQKLCERLQKSPEGTIAVSDFVERQLIDEFGMCSPQSNPTMLLMLLDLENDASVHIQRIINCYVDWNSEYRRQALPLLESCYIADGFFRNLESNLWNCHEPFEGVYETLNFLIKLDSRFAGEWYNHFFYELCNTSVYKQKLIMDKVLINPIYGYGAKFDQIIQSILYGYDFQTAEELADFSYILCCKIAMAGGTEYPILWINDSLKRLEHTRKVWKRAVEATPYHNFPAKVEEEIKRTLICEINDLMETEKSAKKEEKNSLIKKLFGKNKK